MDEFQDTSYTQYQLLEKLTKGWEKNDGRTLFIVSDPMQSIYRFREAEVGLFIRMRSKGIHHIDLIPLTLAVNFRSASRIVEWNHENFSKIFLRLITWQPVRFRIVQVCHIRDDVAGTNKLLL